MAEPDTKQFKGVVKEKVDSEIARMVALGYAAEHLVVTADGQVMFDPEAANYSMYLKVFHGDKKSS